MIKIYRTREEYYEDHQVCPKCGSGTSSTYMGFVFVQGKPYKDENICKCSCGWKGLYDDLVRKSKIKRPNAIMFVKEVQKIKYIIVYVHDKDEDYWGPYETQYIHDSTSLDPFVNWLSWIPGKEWVYPIVAERDGDGWKFRVFDTYNEVMFESKSTTLEKLAASNNLYRFFNKVLDDYKKMTDDEMLEELNVGRVDKWTKEELEAL